MRIYISGAITDVKNYEENFKKAEEYWIGQGHDCFNPAALNAVLPKNMTYEEFMVIDLLLIDMCDAVYMLNGWEKSCGANREYSYALARDKTILKETDK